MRGDKLSKAERIHLRSVLYKAQKCQCHWCGGIMYPLSFDATHPKAMSLEHLKPVSKGGTDNLRNLVLAHKGCNSERGNKEDT